MPMDLDFDKYKAQQCRQPNVNITLRRAKIIFGHIVVSIMAVILKNIWSLPKRDILLPFKALFFFFLEVLRFLFEGIFCDERPDGQRCDVGCLKMPFRGHF